MISRLHLIVTALLRMYSSLTNTRLQSFHPSQERNLDEREGFPSQQDVTHLPGTQPAQERHRLPRRSTQVRSEEAVTQKKNRVYRKKLPAQINFWVFGDFWVQGSGKSFLFVAFSAVSFFSPCY